MSSSLKWSIFIFKIQDLLEMDTGMNDRNTMNILSAEWLVSKLVGIYFSMLFVFIAQKPSMFFKRIYIVKERHKRYSYHGIIGFIYLACIILGFLNAFSLYHLNRRHLFLFHTFQVGFIDFYIINKSNISTVANWKSLWYPCNMQGLLGCLLTFSAAYEFQHKNVKNVASGTLDQHAIVTYSEMIEHLFYQIVNFVQIVYFHILSAFPAEKLTR